MRAFDADYLRRTRTGMWDDSRVALEPLALSTRERILDVGCGTGELSAVLAEESPAEVVGCDADSRLLSVARTDTGIPVVTGDALQLPFPDNSFDLVVCQALLINLPDPTAALEEFARVSSDLVAAVEPDNGAVRVESTVPAESPLERRARQAYLEGVETDVTLGAADSSFRQAGLEVVDVRRYEHERTATAPYDEAALTAARRKATGAGLADDRATMLAGELTEAAYDELYAKWRAMGRDVVSQMADGRYQRQEYVPFYVTVGR